MTPEELYVLLVKTVEAASGVDEETAKNYLARVGVKQPVAVEPVVTP